MTLRGTLAAATLLAVPTLATAQPVTGLYIGAGAGVNWVQDADIDIGGPIVGLPPNVTVSNAGEARFDTGWVGVLALGWGFGNGFRAEIEGSYRENELRTVAGFGGNPWVRESGEQRSYGVMVNGYYDFDFRNFGLPTPSWIQPYIGIGLGAIWTEWDGVTAVSGANGLTVRSDQEDVQFAYQAIVGLAVPLTQWGARGLSLTAEYRFLGTISPELETTVRNQAGVVVARGNSEPENYNHSILLGLRYAFNQPVPAPAIVAPAPAPAPAPARTYLVFFDWDRADLTDRARQIIAEAAQNAPRVQTTRIEVAGHADRSGTPAYNQRLSQRRADAVAAELVRNGVSRNDIVVQAFGESRPLVPTADGVREPQNRRVEIVLR